MGTFPRSLPNNVVQIAKLTSKPVPTMNKRPQKSCTHLASVLVSVLLLVCTAFNASAIIDATLQMQLGNPSGATTDPNNHSHYLIQRTVQAIDYSDSNSEPNWASWDLTASDVGSAGRGNFITDTTLPAGFYRVTTSDYTSSGYDRGHNCPSA